MGSSCETGMAGTDSLFQCMLRSLSKDAPCSVPCPCNQENRHKNYQRSSLPGIPLFSLWPCVHFKCLLIQGVPSSLSCHQQEGPLLFFPQSPLFMFFVSTLSFLDAVHQLCVSAVCWGQAAFIFVLQLEADRGVPVWPDLPVWGWKVLVCYSGVMDQLCAAPSVCFRKGLEYLQRRFRFPHALQHKKGAS